MPGAAMKALEVDAGECTVPLEARSATECVSAGSGVLLHVAGVGFVVTAGHCAWWARQDGWALGVACRDGTRLGLERFELIATWPDANRHAHDHNDVAILRLNGEQKAELDRRGWRFVGLHAFDDWYDASHWPPNHALCPLGYPDEIREEDNMFGRRCLTLCAGDAGTLQNFDSGMHISLVYPDPSRGDSVRGVDGQLMQPTHPQGFSGGGVWSLPMNKFNRWVADDVRLAGIITEFRVDCLRLRCTKIGIVRQMLQEKCRDLGLATQIVRPRGLATPNWWPGLR